MIQLCSLTLFALFALPTPQPADTPTLEDTLALYREVASARDEPACAQLFRERPHWVLASIAGDLELALVFVESGADAERASRLQERARWAGRIAARTLDRPLIADYAACFTGWQADQRRQYREAQQIRARSLEALTEGEREWAIEASVECVDRFIMLGDWWGVSLSYGTLAETERAMGNLQGAMVAYSRMRTIAHSLGLLADEFRATLEMATLAYATEENERGVEAATRARELNEQLLQLTGTSPRSELAEVIRIEASMLDRLGRSEQAEASRKEAAEMKESL